LGSEVRPLGHRLLIVPDQAVTATEGGIVIPDAYNDTPPMSGIVKSIGAGHLRDRRIRTAAIARCMRILDDAEVEAATKGEALAVAKEELGRYLRDAEDLGSIAEVGQRVIFPMEAGHEIVIGEHDESLVIVAEESVLAVCDAAEEQAA
jgi:co-chaperonin GroES (HSP10)